jgi:hypothetical protein
MPRVLARLDGQIMRYFKVLERDHRIAGGPVFADRVLGRTLLGEAHSAKVDTGFA